jgi:glutamate/tyrosine decarboxylase-like PLP-dependent enzyme
VISDQSHITVITALRMLGLGASVLRVAADAQGRMIPAELKKALAPLSGPTIVCAQVGNVNSGACDPIDQIASIVHAKDGWLHVDGAFGLWARVSEQRQPLVKGLELADSWSVDAHKWLNVPYDSGLALCAHPEDHRAAMSLSAEYLQQSEGKERDNFDWAPEFSRRARGFTVYAAIRQLGREGIVALIERCCERARQFGELLRAHPKVKVLNDVVLNQVLVRFADSDDVTKAVMKKVEQDGVCWMSGTTWQGKAAMRISVSNWSTSERDVELSVASILKAVEAR